MRVPSITPGLWGHRGARSDPGEEGKGKGSWDTPDFTKKLSDSRLLPSALQDSLTPASGQPHPESQALQGQGCGQLRKAKARLENRGRSWPGKEGLKGSQGSKQERGQGGWPWGLSFLRHSSVTQGRQARPERLGPRGQRWVRASGLSEASAEHGSACAWVGVSLPLSVT